MNLENINVSRGCGDCSVCCFVAQIPFEHTTKPPHKRCLHVLNDRGTKPGVCGIFGQSCRPDVCNKFQCSWHRGYGSEMDRPDVSGVMLNIYNLNGGTWIFVVEIKEGAVLGLGKGIILDMINKYDYPAIVTSYGIKPPKDTGDKVIIKDSLMNRAKNLAGAKIASLTDDVGIYKLIDSRVA